LIVIEDPQHAVDAGRRSRSATSTGPGDPGAILSGKVMLINAALGRRGVDLDVKYRFAIGAWGSVT
jgi:hypothetical protein